MSDEIKRGPGRPPLTLPQEAATAPVTPRDVAMSRAEQIRAERAQRGSDVLNDTVMRLSVREHALDRGAWSYRFVNDDGDRIYQMQSRGYEITSDRAGMTKADNAAMGSEVSAYAGIGDDGKPMKSVLMRIPKEIYDDDQRAKARAIDATEASLKSGAVPSAGGENTYIPSGGKSALTYT